MKRKEALFLAFLTVIVFSAYWRTLGYDLIWDDELLFRHNLLFIENRPFSSALTVGYFSEQLGMSKIDHYYRPLLTLSFWLENKAWGIHNVTLRLTNLVITMLALAFLYFFLKSQSEDGYFPEIATLLAALNPLNIDNIVWVVGRGDLFVFLWGVLALLSLDRAISKKKPLWLLGSSLFFLLGISSKETFILFLPLLLLFEILKRKKVSWPYHALNAALTVSFFVLKNMVLGIKNIRLVVYRNIGEDIKAVLGTTGYYFRNIVFPLRYKMFLPVNEAMKAFHLVFGLLAILFFIILIIWLRKDRSVLWPASLFAVFLGGHVVLVFSNVFPFQIYSRYMMIAAVGFWWIVALFLGRFKEKTRLTIVFILLLLFIPSIILNANAFKSKEDFWQRAYGSLPRDSYVLFQRAQTFLDKRDYLSAEVALNKSLTVGMRRETAILVSLLYAEVAMAQANYDHVLRWLESIEPFQADPNLQIARFIPFYVNTKKGKIYLSRGNPELAEKLFLENVRRFGNLSETHTDLYNMYIGLQMWDKAAAAEAAMKKVSPRYFSWIDTQRTQKEFAALSFGQRLAYFVLYRNFGQAIAEIKALPSLDVDHQIFLAKLFYFKGETQEGEKTIADILQTNPPSTDLLNKIGNFYLTELFRAKEALAALEKSLALNPAQPGVLAVTQRLKDEYLKELVEVWK